MSRKVDDTMGLSNLFHLNSEPWLNERNGHDEPFVQKTKTYQDAERISLPDTEMGTVGQLAIARHSVRAFSETPFALKDLTTLLRTGYMAINPNPKQSGQKFLRRPVPSAGGLYPLEIYLLVRNVAGLAKGIYHYDALADDLEILSIGEWEGDASKAFLSWQLVENAPVIICIGAVFERTQSKYGPRGYRYALLEAGHVAQNMCLSAIELELSSLCQGGYIDTKLNQLLCLSGSNEAVLYTIAIGSQKKDRSLSQT